MHFSIGLPINGWDSYRGTGTEEQLDQSATLRSQTAQIISVTARTGRRFFKPHPLPQLSKWHDHSLRLSQPLMREESRMKTLPPDHYSVLPTNGRDGSQ